MCKIEFEPISRSNIKTIKSWLESKHVKQWWVSDDWKKTEEKYINRIGSKNIGQYIVIYNSIRIAFIQWYKVSSNVIGIDQYIGESSYLYKGIGKKIITSFIKSLKKEIDFTKVIVDPSKDNLAAIKCYKKVGFIITETNSSLDQNLISMELTNH